jgi:hypothetical protein
LPNGWTDTQSCGVPGVGLGDGDGDFVGVGLFVGVGDLVGVGLLVGVGDLVAGPDADGPDGVGSLGVTATVVAPPLGEGGLEVTERDEPGEL